MKFFISDAIVCCQKLIISTGDNVDQKHDDKMGEFWYIGLENDRSVYKMTTKDYYLSWKKHPSNSSRFSWGVSYIS